MDPMRTVKGIAASASLLPLLQAAPWVGEIAAVFHRSILCSAPDKRLLHLHTGPRLASPFSLRLQGDFAHVLREVRLVQGMPVRKIGFTMDMAEHVHLRLDASTYYQSPSHVMSEIEPETMRVAWQVVGTAGRPEGFERLPGAAALVTALQRALAERDAAPMLAAAHRLVGLGPGLTPSGDDFLVGCLRGLWLFRWNGPAVHQTLDRLREALLPDLDARTTRVGAEFIRYALDGAFAEILDRAALSLLGPARPQAVRSATRRLLTQGETSGTDTALGLLTCLEALLFMPDREPLNHRPKVPAPFSTSAATRE